MGGACGIVRANGKVFRCNGGWEELMAALWVLPLPLPLRETDGGQEITDLLKCGPVVRINLQIVVRRVDGIRII